MIMTREEQVKKYAPEVFGVQGNPYAIAFMDGIKFADEHPKNLMYKKRHESENKNQ